MRRPPTSLFIAAVPAWLATATFRQFLRIRQALVQAGEQAVPANVEHRPATASARVLMVGDSTGVGVGAESEHHTLHGLLRQEFASIEVCNRCTEGARIGDVIGQARRVAAEARRFDVALIVAGGNDVLHGTDAAAVSARVREVVDIVASVSRQIVWLGCAEVGRAPVLLPPFSWWFSWRTHLVARAIAAAVRGRPVDFVDFSSGVQRRRIGRDRRHLFASDGVHPTGLAYRYCYEVLKARPAMRCLTRATPHKPVDGERPTGGSGAFIECRLPDRTFGSTAVRREHSPSDCERDALSFEHRSLTSMDTAASSRPGVGT